MADPFELIPKKPKKPAAPGDAGKQGAPGSPGSTSPGNANPGSASPGWPVPPSQSGAGEPGSALTQSPYAPPAQPAETAGGSAGVQSSAPSSTPDSTSSGPPPFSPSFRPPDAPSDYGPTVEHTYTGTPWAYPAYGSAPEAPGKPPETSGKPSGASGNAPGATRPATPVVAPSSPTPSSAPPSRPASAAPARRRRRAGFGRGMVAGVLTFLVAAALVAGAGLIGYALIASGLPAPGDLRNRTSAFQTTRIYDREGNLLNAAFDPNEGLRTAVPLDRISPWLIKATLATEDVNFYKHPGVDPVALTRALYYAFQEGEFVSGASTIPQQLVKMVFLSPDRTATRKIKEAILASEISRRYSKEQILEIYLNELFYGNLSYGVEAAAQTYFDKDVADLTLAEAALLAGLPQLPASYDPYTHPDRAKERQGVVLGLMLENGLITEEEADAAWQEPLTYQPLEFDLVAPHFTIYVRQQLEQLLGPDALYKAGLSVETTLDPRLQAEAERIVKENVDLLAGNNVSNGALVSMRPDTGEVLALVGSADFDNVEIDGQVNMALAPRQPGSTIKPLVYLAAFEQADKQPSERWTPGTMVADISESFPDGANPPYIPVNYDGQEHGILPVRMALGNSYNIPAVRALQQVGLPYFLSFVQRLGITTFTRPDYGLSLALGAGETPLTEMTSAFATIANQGKRVQPVTIRKITDSAGNVLCEQATDRPCQTISNEQAISPVDAFLMTDILSDNDARSAAFGPNSVLKLDRPAAAKTGTTNDIRDILTLGFTPQLVTGVWVGNADNTPMRNVSGISGAGPIWHEFMTTALASEPVMTFTPPAGVRQYEVCADTGTLPGNACPQRKTMWFAEDRPPLTADHDLWQSFRVDRNTGQLATEFTPPDQVEERAWKVYPVQYREWAQRHGIEQPPFVPPTANTTIPMGNGGPLGNGGAQPLPTAPSQNIQLSIRSPGEGETVSGVLTVYGTVNLPNLASYELQYGETHNPGAFSPPVAGPYGGIVMDTAMAQWDTTGLREGPYTLRLLAHDTSGGQYETRVHVFVAQAPPTNAPPTATPMPVYVEPTPTWPPIATVIPPVPPSPIPAEPPTPIPPDTPTPEPPPTDTPAPVPTDTPAETLTPTWTPDPLFMENTPPPEGG